MKAYDLYNLIVFGKVYTSKTSETITYIIIILSALAFLCLLIQQIRSRHK